MLSQRAREQADAGSGTGGLPVILPVVRTAVFAIPANAEVGTESRPTEDHIPDYRTKRVILEIYDEMQRRIISGTPYGTILSPHTADPEVAHLIHI
jgi:hypothetical protein